MDLTDSIEHVSYERQLEIVMPRIHLSQNRATTLIHDPAVFELIEPRFRAGFDAFGSQMFHKPAEALIREAREEIADALIYLSVANYQSGGSA